MLGQKIFDMAYLINFLKNLFNKKSDIIFFNAFLVEHLHSRRC